MAENNPAKMFFVNKRLFFISILQIQCDIAVKEL